jgi:hypothetical protein
MSKRPSGPFLLGKMPMALFGDAIAGIWEYLAFVDEDFARCDHKMLGKIIFRMFFMYN